MVSTTKPVRLMPVAMSQSLLSSFRLCARKAPTTVAIPSQKKGIKAGKRNCFESGFGSWMAFAEAGAGDGLVIAGSWAV